jgi:hypothetical protein
VALGFELRAFILYPHRVLSNVEGLTEMAKRSFMEQLGPNQGPEEWINILRKQLYPISFSSN